MKKESSTVPLKRKSIIVTGKCNNNCIFCVATYLKDCGHRPLEVLRKEMEQGLKEGYNQLVLNGGEPTLHPEFLEIIRLAKNLGYTKVQNTTNGRMYSYNGFLKKAIAAGLDEIEFSVHGHNSKIHDSITRSQGSFEQAIAGIRNALKEDVTVGVDIVVNRQNYRYFPEIVDFFIKLGVRRFDILYPAPFGNAWSGREAVYFNIQDALPYLHRGFSLAKSKRVLMWTHRFPSEYLAGFEYLIEDASKLMNVIDSRGEIYSYCIDINFGNASEKERCGICGAEQVCTRFKSLLADRNTKVSDRKKIPISSRNHLLLEKETLKSNGNLSFEYVSPGKEVEYRKEAVRISDFLPSLRRMLDRLGERARVRNIPVCFLGEKYAHFIESDGQAVELRGVDFKDKTKSKQVLEKFSRMLKIKGLQCKGCSYFSSCEGMFQDYIKLFGFNELRPLKK
jgi:MoaA/NifB/PqqE/SkfB family radical SAM enzyme